MNPFPFVSLLHWWVIRGRHSLPWRQYFHLWIKDLGYRIWLSEVLLQQTQADRVVTYYNKILLRFPTIESLSQASYEEFFPYYQGLGYYSRARNILATARIITERHAGIFPDNTQELIRLPGVGPYTAAAIEAFAYNESVLSFDTNLEKIFSRFYHGSRFEKLSRSEKNQIEQDFLRTGISGREINAALMDFWTLVSHNTKPANQHAWDCLMADYPLTNCEWIKSKGEFETQEKKKKYVFPSKDARIQVVLHENHKIYYSSAENEYEPFTLPPTEENIRHFVQEYFRTRHWLELSVRPVHSKLFKNDIPYVVCNAQIQAWKAPFREYKKKSGIFIEHHTT
jgi:A/G-specific adenine glycosylase